MPPPPVLRALGANFATLMPGAEVGRDSSEYERAMCAVWLRLVPARRGRSSSLGVLRERHVCVGGWMEAYRFWEAAKRVF